MAQRDKCKQVEGQSVFDRMNNPAGYTGAHAARFEAPQAKQAAKPGQGAQQQAPGASAGIPETRSTREKCQPVAGQSVYDRMTNPSGYTGAHAAKFGIDGAKQQPVKEAPVKDAAPEIKQHAHPAGQSTREKCKEVEGGSVFDRLTNASGYTGAHAARFDANGKGVGSERVAKGGQDPSGLQNILRK